MLENSTACTTGKGLNSDAQNKLIEDKTKCRDSMDEIRYE